MMSDGKSSSASTGGIGFCGLLAVLFIGLKLTGYIDWAWVWVVSPLWVGLAAIVGIAALIFLGVLVAHTWDNVRSRRSRRVGGP